jgi:hypothetical protein
MSDGNFRWLLRQPLTDEQRKQVELKEAWEDMARAAQGKRILERLNSGRAGVPPSFDALRRASRTFGGLTPSGPPKIGAQPIIKGPSLDDIFQSDYMKRMRNHSPSLPEYTPKGIEPLRSRFSEGPWKVPTGRIDPYPREVTRMPTDIRQDWLRTYYRANPMAAQQARSEARTIIDWAHTHLR